MIFNMVGGGGQSDGPVEAGTIVVTYPPGATCTVTNGSDTYVALDTSGAAAFIVEPGSWTVTATPAGGGAPANKIVTVIAGGWVEVSLNFRLYLYEVGNQYTEITGGWTTSGYTDRTWPFSARIDAASIYIYFSSGVSVGGIGTANKIDLSPYSIIKIELQGTGEIQVFPCSDKSDTFASQLIYFYGTPSGSREIISIDITEVNSQAYIPIQTSGTATIYNVWLEV